MPLPLAPSASPIAMMQKIAANSRFDGTLPEGDPYIQNGMNKYPTGTSGGLFYFQNPRPVTAPCYTIDFGAAVNYELAIVSLDETKTPIDGERTLISKGNAAYVSGSDHYGLTLGPHQAFELRVTSPTTTTPMVATFWVMDATAFFA